MTELTRATWPLPWWVVAVPGLVIAALTGLVMSGPSGWAYVALARVSSLPAESLVIVGPVACVAACWVMERFANRDSMLANTIAPRSSGEMAVRIVAVHTLAWGAAFLLVSTAALVYWSARATGGTAHPAELGLAAVRLAFFVITGAMIGAIVARWHASLWAVLWSVFWVLVAPIGYAVLLPELNTLANYFVFPAVSGSDHRDLGWGVALIAVWWIAVIAALLVTTAGWFAAVARRTRAPLVAGLAATLVMVAAGVAIPVVVPEPFVDGAPPPIVCAAVEPVRVCVTREQQPLLGELTPAVDAVLVRLGEHMPERLTAVTTSRAKETLVAQGVDAGDIVTVAAGTSAGLDEPVFNIGASLGGLDACGDAIIAGADADPTWAFAFATWLAPDSIYARSDILSDFDDDAVLEWYSEHEEELRTCTYSGSGPA